MGSQRRDALELHRGIAGAAPRDEHAERRGGGAEGTAQRAAVEVVRHLLPCACAIRRVAVWRGSGVGARVSAVARASASARAGAGARARARVRVKVRAGVVVRVAHLSERRHR